MASENKVFRKEGLKCVTLSNFVICHQQEVLVSPQTLPGPMELKSSRNQNGQIICVYGTLACYYKWFVCAHHYHLMMMMWDINLSPPAICHSHEITVTNTSTRFFSSSHSLPVPASVTGLAYPFPVAIIIFTYLGSTASHAVSISCPANENKDCYIELSYQLNLLLLFKSQSWLLLTIL